MTVVVDRGLTLRLYVAELSPSAHAIATALRRVCEESVGAGGYYLEIVDLQRNRHLAENDHVIALPTLIREYPPPRRTIVGDLSDEEALRRGLDLPAPSPKPASAEGSV